MACIKHSARTGGSKGEALSLSADRAVATRFSKAREEGRIFTVSTLKDPDNFRSIEHILKYDGPRLVKERKITAGTLRAAIKNAFIQGESEVFYVLGSIPDDFIEAVN